MKIRQSPLHLSRRPVPSHDPYRVHWDVVNIGTEKEPILELHANRDIAPREDDADAEFHGASRVFPNDSAAMIYVMTRACRDGCPEAREAVMAIVRSWGKQ
jgi:hypothetical protein